MSGGARDLNIKINGDSSGFDAATFRAQSRLKELEQTHRSYTRQWNAAHAEDERRTRTLEQAERERANLQIQAQREDAARTAQLEAERAHAVQTAGKLMLASSTAVAAGLAYSGKAAIQWQSDFAGVKKTVDGTPEQLDAVEKGLRQLAKTLPTSHSDIAAVAEAAGQLGIATEDVVSFTKVMIDLGETTNLSATDAATALARISNIMGTAASDVSRMGSTIVDLGNNSATTEADIVAFATRLAAAGRQAGMSEADLFAFAATLSSVGVEAEAGGTAMSKVFTAVADSVRDGGDNLKTFARVAGVSTADFRRAFEQDAARAIAMFIDGMGRASAAGESTSEIFSDLALTDQRLMRAILSAGSAQGLLNEQLDRANSAWQDNTALIAEAEQRYETAEARIQIAKNSLQDTAITLGETFLPMIAGAADGVADLASWVGNLPEPLLNAAAGIGAVASVLGILTGSAILIIPKIAETYKVLKALEGTRYAKIAGGIVGVGKALGVAAAAFTAAQIAAAAFGEELKSQSASQWTGDLLKLGDTLEVGSIQLAGYADEMWNLKDAFRRITAPTAFDSFGDWSGDLLGMNTSVDQLTDGFANMGQALATMYDANPDLAAEKFRAILEETGATTEALLELMPAYRDTLQETENQQTLTGQSAEDLAGSLEEIDPAAAAAQAAMEDAAEALEEWKTEIIKADASFISLLEGYDEVIEANKATAEATAAATESSKDSWEDFYDGVTVSMQDWIAKLEEQAKAQAEWRDNLLEATLQVRTQMPADMREAAEAMVDELAKAGPDGAAALATFTDASAEERERLVAAWSGAGTESGSAFVDGLAAVPVPVLEIDADASKAEDRLSDVIRSTTNATGRMLIEADGEPALEELGTVTTTVDEAGGTVTIYGDDGEARTVLSEYLYIVDTATGTITVTGTDAEGRRVTVGLTDWVDQQSGSITVRADTTSALESLGRVFPIVDQLQNRINSATASLGGGGGGGGGVQMLRNTGGRLPAFAAGGRYPGKAPANPHVDNLLGVDEHGIARVRVRSREYAVQQPSADYYGDDILNAINQRTIPKTALLALSGVTTPVSVPQGPRMSPLTPGLTPAAAASTGASTVRVELAAEDRELLRSAASPSTRHPVRLVVGDQEFDAYVDERATGRAIDALTARG